MSSLPQVAAREEEQHRMAVEVMTFVAKLQDEIVPCGVTCWELLGIAGWDSIWDLAFLFWKHSNVGVHRPLKFGDIESNLRFWGLELFIAPYMIWFMVWWILFLVDPDAGIDGL